MVRTILVDDEPRGLNTLKKLLQEYCSELKVVAECANADSAKEKIELLEPQLVFLDISLPDKSGFDLLAVLEKINFEIIFVTAHNQYTFQEFHNISQPGSPGEMKLCIPSIKGFQVVELKNVLFCEASGSYTNFHFTNQPLICSARPIYEYEEMLADSGFIRIHKSYMVNLLHIKEYIRGEGGMVILSNAREIEVSRRK